MANWVTIVKTSPDVSLPLEPHPGTNPAAWLGMVPGPPALPKQRPEDIPPADWWFQLEPHPSLNIGVWDGMAQPPVHLIPRIRPEQDVYFALTPPATPTYDYGWTQGPQTAARPKPNAPPQADPYVAAPVVAATYDYGWAATFVVPQQPKSLKQYPADMFVRSIQPSQDYTCPPQPAVKPQRVMGQTITPDIHVRLIVVPTYDYGWQATYRAPKIPRVEGRQPIDMHYTPLVEITLLDDGKMAIGTPYNYGIGGTTLSIGGF